MFILEGNLTNIRFLSPCNVGIGNVLIYGLEGNLACTRFISKCNVLVGNMVGCARRNLTCVMFPLACNVLAFVIEMNLACTRLLYSYNVVICLCLC